MFWKEGEKKREKNEREKKSEKKKERKKKSVRKKKREEKKTKKRLKLFTRKVGERVVVYPAWQLFFIIIFTAVVIFTYILLSRAT